MACQSPPGYGVRYRPYVLLYPRLGTRFSKWCPRLFLMVCPCVPRILKCVLSLWDSEMPHAPNWGVIVPPPRSQELVERCRLAHNPRINTKSTYPRKCTRMRTYTNHRSLKFHAFCVKHSQFETLSQLHVGRNRRQ